MDDLDGFRCEVNHNIALGVVDLPVVDDQGTTPVVVALEEELLSTVLGRLRSVGGYANLFVRSPGGRVDFVSVIDSASAIAVADDDLTGQGDAPGSDATIGIFLQYLQTQPNGVKLSADAVGHAATVKDPHPVEFQAA